MKNRIREYRKKLGISQDTLSKNVKVKIKQRVAEPKYYCAY